MTRPYYSCLVLGALIALGAEAGAKTWFVGGSGADFNEIQDAIVAASDGDVIIVRPDHLYRRITINNKSLSIRASGAQRFAVEAATIGHLAASKTVHLGGVNLALAPPYGYDHSLLLLINQCAGEVDIENVSFSVVDFGDYTNVEIGTLVRVFGSNNVSFTDVVVKGINVVHGLGGVHKPPFDIEASTVQLLGAQITGHRGGKAVRPWPGGDALSITDSQVLLTHPRITGGPGEDAYYCEVPGAGGDGMVVFCGDVIVTGDDTDFVAGGAGGAGIQQSTCCADGAEGGTGLVAHCDDTVAIAGPVALRGGSGGRCPNCNPCMPGIDGLPFTGNPSFLPRPYPVLDTTGDLHPGGSLSITVRGEPGANALLLLSNRRGWIWLPDVYGAPWTALPGGLFFVLGIGRIQPDGLLNLPPLPLPDDPSLQGFAITNQAVVLAASGVELTNGFDAHHRRVRPAPP